MPRTSARRTLLLYALGALAGTTVRAQEPAPALQQLAHTAWAIEDGAPASARTFAQTADGVLWLGTHTGLYRFDGVRFERFEPPAGQALSSLSVNMLFALPTGELWIGYAAGGASVLAGGRLTHHGEREGLPRGTLTAFARDSVGGLWAATTTGLARRVGDRWQRVGDERGYPGGMTADLLVDRRGTLWAAALAGVYVLPRGATRFAWRAPSLDLPSGGVGAPREAPDGSVWGASWSRGLVRLSDAAGDPPSRAQAIRYRDHHGVGLLIDRRAHVWLLGDHLGIVRIPLSALTESTSPVGAAAWQTMPGTTRVTGSQVLAVFEDREGTVWVGGDHGVDRFRASKLTPLVPVPSVKLPALAAGDSGVVWMVSAAAPLVAIGERVVAYPTVPADVTCAYRDREGGVWFGGVSGLWRRRGAAFTRVALPPGAVGAEVQAIAADRAGALWLSVRGRAGPALFRRRGGHWAEVRAASAVENETALAVVADSVGRTWLGYTNNRVVLVVAGSAANDSVRVFSDADGLDVGLVKAIHVRGDRVWVGGDLGVAVLDGAEQGSRFRPLSVTGGPLRGVSGIVETADGEVWLNGVDGVVRLPAAEVRRATRVAGYRAQAERFDHRDGANGPAIQLRPLPTVVEGTDGRLWFTSETGVAWVDPRRVRRNPVPPPVHVRSVEAGGRRYEAAGRLTLPTRTTTLDIAYAALSLAVPERVRFRYRLVGLDTAWQDAGTRREAFYTNLDPGRYRFEVIAANEDGVWNTRGAALDVVIPPTFWQTNLFLAICAAAAGGTAWGLAAWRQRRAAAAIQARFAVTLAERTRVARELHDTLLSGVAGIAMRLDAVATRAGSAAGVDVAALDELREQARHTLVDARRAVVGMRASGDALVPVSAQLADAARRVFAGTDVDARVASIGAPCRYPPDVEEQVVRVATEAMANARKHAACRAVHVTCAYRRDELRVDVRDDGRGFDLVRADANGHYGLVGMRERAAAVGAELTVDSAPGQGTTVRVVAPLRPPH